MNYDFENCRLSIERRELSCDGVLRSIEPQVFALLHFLIVNRDRVVSRDEVFDAVWEGRIVSESCPQYTHQRRSHGHRRQR